VNPQPFIDRARRAATFALCSVLLLAAPAAAQTAEESLQALRKDVEALKAGQTQVQKDLAEIKDLLRARAAGAPAPAPPPDIALSIAGRPVKGDRTAKVVLFDFTDYQ